MSVREHNRSAWDRQVALGNPWTRPVDTAMVDEARQGRCRLFLTPTRPIPDNWLGNLSGARVLCLASGGGQQGPLLAAAGAEVTVLDNSPRQLEQDRSVARRESLRIDAIEGDMADLSIFAGEDFDLVVHPVSNCFVSEVRPVWREAYRVLRPGGRLLSGFNNPALYIFDENAYDNGRLEVRRRLPYSDAAALSPAERWKALEQGKPLEFSHTLDDQIGGQIDAGFIITGFYEDSYPREQQDPLGQYMPIFLATRAQKPAREADDSP